jgi:hypothetical protein
MNIHIIHVHPKKNRKNLGFTVYQGVTYSPNGEFVADPNFADQLEVFFEKGINCKGLLAFLFDTVSWFVIT